MLGTVLWAKTVLAGVKASAVVLNRVLVAFIVCVQKIFFSWAPDFVDPSVSRNFENKNSKVHLWCLTPMSCDMNFSLVNYIFRVTKLPILG
jgi:hypothetical protein